MYEINLFHQVFGSTSSTLMCQLGEIKGILRFRRLMVVTLDWDAKGKGKMKTPTGTRRQQQQSWLT